MRSLSGSEAKQLIESLIALRKDQYSDALIQALIFRENEKLKPYFVRVCVRRKGTPETKEFRNEYPGVTLLQKKCSLAEVQDLVGNFVDDKKLIIDGVNLDVEQGRAYLEDRELISSDEEQDAVGWAYRAFRASLMNSGSYPHGPLIADGLPAFPTAMYAARASFGVDLDHNSGRQGTLNILIPHYGARITKVGFQKKPSRLKIGVEAGTAPLSDFILKGWYSHERKDGNFETNALKKTNAFKVSGKPGAYAFWLLHKKSGDIVDERSHLYGGRPKFGEEAEDSYSPDSIRAMIKGGESDKVEYKRADSKNVQEPFSKNDIAKEMVAFTNHEGGFIFLGVADDCEVIGLDDPMKLRDWVSNVAANNCKPAITVQYRTHEIDGKKIGMIAVPKGTPGMPYQRNDGKFFVRRMASSRPADPHEMQQLSNRGSSSPGQFAFDVTQGL